MQQECNCLEMCNERWQVALKDFERPIRYIDWQENSPGVDAVSVVAALGGVSNKTVRQ